jgi:hypothetical protein
MKNPLGRPNQILMAYRGDSMMDAGYFYAPYIPLQSTPVVGIPPPAVPSVPSPEEENDTVIPEWARKTVYRSIDDPWETSTPD